MLPTHARLLTVVCALATTARAVLPLEVKGKDFVNSHTGDRFQILGVDYQPGGSSGFSLTSDPLSDPDACLRDAAIMQTLGVNTVRIYNLQPGLDHDECASIFNAAGIYMILDVNSPLSGGYLDRSDPNGTYNAVYFQQVFGVVEAFKNFPNTLGFFAGNEVINEQSVEDAPAYVRAVQRDMKNYIAKNVKRTIPVGYSAADVRPILVDTLNYFMCEDASSPSSSSDFFGLNSYSWCGASTYTESGYDVLTKDFTSASLPVFFSEYGCNAVQPREFSEVQALYGDQMDQVFSGGLVYEYSEEENDYGLVSINSSDTVTLLIDYYNLMDQYSKLDESKIKASSQTQTSIKAPACDASLITNSTFLNTWDLPATPSGVQDMINNGLNNATVVGNLVQVTTTALPQTIYNYQGQVVSGIKLNVLADDESNAPNGTTLSVSGSNSTSTSSSSSTTSSSSNKKSAADKMSVPFLGLFTGATLMALFML